VVALVDRLRVGVLASGRGTNLQAILDASRAGRIDADVVVALSDVPGAAALERARRAGVPAVCVDPGEFPDVDAYERRLVEELDARRVGLVALAGYMRLAGQVLLEAYRGRIMNVHPALLPSFRGLEAQRQALEYGVKVSGCTVHFVDEGVDTGPIVAQEAVEVKEGDTVESLSARILEKEHVLYPRAIQLFAEGRLVIEGRRVRVLPAGGRDSETGGSRSR